MPANLSDVQFVDHGPTFDALGLVHRVHVPEGPGPFPTLVMIHGFQGNEDVTWIFARNVSPAWIIVTPRAPFPAAGSFSWAKHDEHDYADSATLQDGLAALTHFVEWLPDYYPVDRSRLVLLGFSQGAAMSYAYGVSHPVLGIAALCGFIPAPEELRLSAFKNLPILILHGTKDLTIPVEVARKDRDRLVEAGAHVTYLESDVGHKVSTDGMRTLKQWLAERLE